MGKIKLDTHKDVSTLLSYSNKVQTLVYCAGVGTGKSYALCRFTHLQALKHKSNKSHLIISANHQLLKREIIPTYISMLNYFGYREDKHYIINWSDKVITYIKWNITINFLSYQSGLQNLRGFNFQSVAIDEIGDMHLDAYQEILRRFRGKSNDKLTMYLSGTPQGSDIDHFYFKILLDKELSTLNYLNIEDQEIPKFKYKKDLIILHHPTHINILNLGQHYIPLQQDALGKNTNLYKQQVLGLPVPAQSKGSLFQVKGSNLKNIDLVPYGFDELVLSFDFNISKCSFTVTKLEGGIVRVIYSNKSDAMDTYTACEQFKLIFPLEQYKFNKFIVTGDAAGRARSTSTKDNKTDYSIIEEELKHYNIELKVPKSNPPVSNSVRHTNRLLSLNLIEISKTNASFLIHALSSCVESSSGGINKSGKDDVSHIVDAFRYGVEYLDPSVDRKVITGSI